MHYVEAMVEAAAKTLRDEEVAAIYRFKQSFDRGEFILNAGRPDEINAKDLLWQSFDKYDQIGMAMLAFQLWVGVITHPKTKSSSFEVGGPPEADRAVAANNKLLSKANGPFMASFNGGSQPGDGSVIPLEGSIHSSGSIPLEVGSVSPATLAFHLFQKRVFARWPYGSKFVYVFEPSLPPGKELRLWELVTSHASDCIDCNRRDHEAH